jgi:predicted DsbA family dithiol-disulfide isomerase
MRVEIYSDIVCPWCYVGRKRFEQALAQRPDVHADVRWLPFELNPDLPETGVDREAYLAAKFGDAERRAALQEQLREVGASVGIEFRFDLIRKTPNTRAAHALLEIAAENAKQSETYAALFAAYFEQGRDIGDREVLIEIGAGRQLDANESRAALAARRYYPEIAGYERQAAQWGIQGVPTFIFDRRYAVSGAQEPPVFLQVFDRLRQAA